MPLHIWNDAIDFGYGELTNVVYDSGLKLNNSLSGTYITDIRDSTLEFGHYDEFIITSTQPPNTDITASYRVGDYIDDMEDWIVISPQLRNELGISMSKSIVVTDYDILSVEVATDSTGINDGISYEDSAVVGYAIINTAEVGNPGSIIDYADNYTFSGNIITLTDSDLPFEQTNLTISYIPIYFIPEESKRFIQFKLVLETDNIEITPIVTKIEQYYRLNTVPMLDNTFASFYRRL